jgi:predicted ribosome quality control (RQC) complex YloA/Tae2 family protein
LDRLFLRALVEELRPAVAGRRVRTAILDRPSRLLLLGLAPPRPATLALSFLREAPGVFLVEGPRPAGEGAATPATRKLVSTRIVSLDVAELDRILTLSLEGQRLSGRATAFQLILEILGVRADLYLVDAESAGVVEALSSTRARLAAGERYEAPRPPPATGPLAATASEVEHRLARAAFARRTALLAATGSTPLLVREIEWLMEREEMTAGEAFVKVLSRLEEKRPFLYLPRSSPSGRHSLLSPLELASERDLEPQEQASFAEAMARAVSWETEARRFSTLRERLEYGVGKRLGRLLRLQEKLQGEESSLEEPADLRRRGELLLAGLSRARRARDGRSVVLPDLFDAEEKDTEIELDPRLSLPKNAERFFNRARRAERTRGELSNRLEALSKEISFWEALELDMRDAASVVELEALEREAAEQGLSLAPSEATPKKKRVPQALGPRSFLSHRGNAILVGRSGRSNDELTFDLSKPHDLWFHASGIPGAHVVLRLASGGGADEGEIREAAELAAYYSKARDAAAVDVVVTERRHVSRIKGAPRGLVKIASAPETRMLRVAPRPRERENGDR